jgi:hypothetical protein
MRLVIASLALLVNSAMAAGFQVAVMRPTQYLLDHPNAATGDVHTYLQTVRDALDSASISYHNIEESALIEGKIPTGEFLICAYNPDMPAPEANALLAFADHGGHALLCYFCPTPSALVSASANWSTHPPATTPGSASSLPPLPPPPASPPACARTVGTPTSPPPLTRPKPASSCSGWPPTPPP